MIVKVFDSLLSSELFFEIQIVSGVQMEGRLCCQRQ
jgi:hypothetical protein